MRSGLVLRGLDKSFGAQRALSGIDLQVAAGSRTAVVGPSGSGKTTLLRLIAGFETPDAGRLWLDGEMLSDGAAAVPAHRRGIGIVSQDGALFPHLSVAENIGFGLARRAPGRAARIAELMALVELDPALARRPPDALSGGQQQRVALARALARQPRLMLLDEPFSALDARLRAGTRRAVAALLGAAGITAILVTHDQEEALSFADQLAVLRDGRLAQVGPPRELYLRPRDAAVATILGDAVLLPARVADGWADCALGRLPVGDPDRRGAARILLRPEQIRLEPPSGDAPAARVAAVDFGGAACLVTLRLGDSELTVRSAPLEAPEPGAQVGIAVRGAAHVLEEAAGG